MEDGLNVEVDLPDLSDVQNAVELAGDLRVWRSFTARATGRALPFDVNLAAELEDGKFRVSKLEAIRRSGGESVTTESLRRVPVSSIIRKAVESIVVEGKWGENVVDWGPAAFPVRNTYTGPDEEALLLVASLYRLASMVGVPPRAYVADRMGVPRPTVSRWIVMSRQAGFFGPTRNTSEET